LVNKHVKVFAYRVRVLGPVDLASVGGSTTSTIATEPLAPKHRLLLAMLASRHGEWISTEVLIDEMWTDAPLSAAKTLQGFVFRLRRILGPDSVLSRRGSYSLNAQVNADCTEFLQLVAELDLVRTQPSPVIFKLARRAESLWRGDPFADVPVTPLIAKAQQPLREMHSRIRKLRIDAVLELDQAATVVNELQGLVSLEPLREDYWALLVRALYLSGSPADAFAASGNARLILARELGLEPGPILSSFEAAMLRSDRETLRLGSPPTAPNR
jgi:DNA-binding SARP family transcriptional activator